MRRGFAVSADIAIDNNSTVPPNAAGGRYYVSKIHFRGFKSFKNAEVEFPCGYVALAGPNGSGKSNVTDAIRFALGEMSLKSLRAKKVTELINMSSSKAEVTLHISGPKKFEIRRAIREDGKTSYHLDGRHLTRTQVLEALRPYGIEAGSHNIIAQGQVQKIVEMNAKERRAIIDATAGIAEFDDKKKEALSELGKVDSRISEAKIMLAERSSFLAELEKEKDAALSYQEAQANLQRSRATLVHAEFERLNRHFNDLLEKRKGAEEEKEKLEAEAKVLNARRAELDEKRKALSEKLNKGGEREKLMAQIESLKVQIGQNEVRLEEKRLSVSKMEGEIESSKAEGARIKKAIEEMKGEEKRQLEMLKAFKTELEERKKRAGIEEGGNADGSALSKLEEKLSKLLQEKAALAASGEKGGQIAGMAKEKVDGIRDEIGRLKASEPDSGDAEEKYKTDIAGISSQLEKMFEKEKDMNRKLPALDRALLEKKEAVASLKGAVASAAQNPALLFVMQLKKDGMDGIHGCVADLIEVDDKYRTAVEAAAGARLTYVVVDSLDRAGAIISKLKENKAGRCTFIPLTRPMNDNEGKDAKVGLGRLIDYVKYDRLFYPAASFAFGDTVLCQNVAEAKKIGIGSCRMVTLDGELLERSGIITGGTMRGSMMARSSLEKAEKEAEQLKVERDGIYTSLYEIREDMQRLRRERAEAEIKLREIASRAGSASERAKKAAELRKDLEEASEAHKKALAEIKEGEGRLSELEKECKTLSASIGEMKSRAAAEEEKKRKIRGDAQQKYQEALEKYTNLESSLTSRKRETDMLGTQLSELEGKERKGELEAKAAKKAIIEMEEEGAKINSQKEALEAHMREISQSVQKLYDQMQALQKELEEIGAQIGKIEYSKNSKIRECNEIDVKKASVETKLADVKAEWEKYAGVPLLDATLAALEEMRKESEAKLSALGNVNMKAPEMYGQRKKEQEEMQAKVGTLESEKSAVMALMDEIEQKKRSIFVNTFQQVNMHFQKLFKLVFKGEGNLLLDEPSNPLESGLNFRVRGEHDKKDRYLNSMSGGEQSLLALMFIFALQMHKPAPFYILDEAEAALDKENSRKLADFVGQMSKSAQFIVVTHNDAVLQSADVALGVMKTDDGSKIVGVQLASSMPLAPHNAPPTPKDGGDGSSAGKGEGGKIGGNGKEASALPVAEQVMSRTIAKRKKA